MKNITKNLLKKEILIKRFFEILPGAVAWITITSPIWGGILFPVALGYFVLIFNAYWVFQSISSFIFFIIGFLKIREYENINWLNRLIDLENLNECEKKNKLALQKLEKEKFTRSNFKIKSPLFIEKLLFKLSKNKTKLFILNWLKEIENLKSKNIMNWRKIKHIIIIPYYKEEYQVIKRSLEKIACQNYPKENIIVVLGAEARDPNGLIFGKKLKSEFMGKIGEIWINEHTLTAGEIVGKSANMASCGKFAQKIIEKRGWNKDEIIITSCDCDTQFDKNYLACVSFKFVTDELRYYHFYAAPMVYYANIWRVPFFIRIANTLFTINNISNSARTDKFIQISSYSFSWRLLEEIDFWSVDVIPEDFHMFFKALFLHQQKVETVPIFLKNLSNAAESVGWWNSAKNQYEQTKRWAWGVIDDGWMIRSLLKIKKKSFYLIYRVSYTIFDHFTWSILSFIIMFGANIPPLLNKDFNKTVFGQKLPKVSSFMLTITTVLFVLTIIIDMFLKPKREGKMNILQIIFEPLQWVLMPIIGIVFGSLPGLDAQTRLLFAKYLEYRVTEKH